MNHKILPAQLEELEKKYGVSSIVTPPDSIAAAWSSIATTEVIPESVYISILKWFEGISSEDVAVVQGETAMTFKLVNYLLNKGITVLASVTQRKSFEVEDNGKIIKQSEFKHICFRRYER